MTAETLKQQLELANQLHFMKLQYHQGILTNRSKPKSEKTLDRS